MESRQSHEHRSPWTAGAWTQAIKDLEAGTFKKRPEMRFLIILSSDSPISSAESLQQLAELESLPETTETSLVEWDGTEIKKVTISWVGFDARETMKIES